MSRLFGIACSPAGERSFYADESARSAAHDHSTQTPTVRHYPRDCASSSYGAAWITDEVRHKSRKYFEDKGIFDLRQIY